MKSEFAPIRRRKLQDINPVKVASAILELKLQFGIFGKTTRNCLDSFIIQPIQRMPIAIEPSRYFGPGGQMNPEILGFVLS